MVIDDDAARVAAQAVLLHVVQDLILVDDVRVVRRVEALQHVPILRQLRDVDARQVIHGGGDAFRQGGFARARGAGDEHVGPVPRCGGGLAHLVYGSLLGGERYASV